VKPATDATTQTATESRSTTVPTAVERPRWRRSGSRAVPPSRYKLVSLGSLIGGLILWQVLAEVGIVDRSLASCPLDVFRAARLMIDNGSLGSAVASSARLYAAGVGLSVALGIICGVAFGWWRTLGAVFDPWVAVLYSTPLVAVLPLVIVWFGIGFKGQVALVVLVSVFPLLVTVTTGTRQVDEALLRLARSFGASQFAILRSLLLPSLVPYVVTGVRLSVGTGLIGVVIGEYFEGSQGVGGIILQAGVTLNSSQVFVGIFVLAGTALTLTSIIRFFEAKLTVWREP
jgi:ABC-type nitrate/sulfonate/bicarbonate transport system permease component